MGTYAGMFGAVNIPLDKRSEFIDRLLVVANMGGMMSLSRTELFGQSITLLKPVSIGEDGYIDCYCNYFENGCWENAGFSPKLGQLYSNKIGNREFHAVIVAMYVLEEFYSSSHCIANVDGELFDAREYIGWLNHILGEHYTNVRIVHPWQLYALQDEHLSSQDILALANSDSQTIPSLSEIMSCLIIGAIDENRPEVLQEPYISEDLSEMSPWRSFRALRRIIGNIKADLDSSDDEKLHILKSLLTLPAKQRIMDVSSDFKKFAFHSTNCATEVVVHLIADAFSLNFWDLLNEMAPTLNYDFLPTLLDPPSPSSPVQPVSSERFLRTTSDERTFWWKEGGDVEFSNEMRCWLRELQAEYSDILTRLDSISGNRAEIFVNALARAQKECHVYFFAAVFDEFIMHMHHPEVQAAVVLLAQLLDGYMPNGKYFNKDGWIWNTPFSRFNDDFRAYAIKLYYAVLANLPLRNKVFGF